MILSSLQADILLPSIFNEKTSSIVGSGKNTPINTPLSPFHLATPTSDPQMSQAGTSPSPLHLSPLIHAHLVQPNVDRPQPSQAALTQSFTTSQSSLLSQTSQTSSTSQSSYYASRDTTGRASSQTSLPTLIEGGQRSDYIVSDTRSLAGQIASVVERGELSRDPGGPGRSYSTSNIGPPSSTVNINIGPNTTVSYCCLDSDP